MTEKFDSVARSSPSQGLQECWSTQSERNLLTIHSSFNMSDEGHITSNKRLHSDVEGTAPDSVKFRLLEAPAERRLDTPPATTPRGGRPPLTLDFEARLQEKQVEWIRYTNLSLAHTASAISGKDRDIFAPDTNAVSIVGLTASQLEGIAMHRQRVIQRGARHGFTCRHWYSGLCNREDSCEYQHIFDFSKPLICHNFVRHGLCMDQLKGLCYLDHPSSTDGREDEMRPGSRRLLSASPPPKPQHPANPHTPTDLLSVNGGSINEASDQECVFFILGYCPYGDRCRLVHKPRFPSQRPPLLPLWYIDFVTAFKQVPEAAASLSPGLSQKLEVINAVLKPIVNRRMVVNSNANQHDRRDGEPILNEALFLENTTEIPGLSNSPSLRLLVHKVVCMTSPLSYHYLYDPSFNQSLDVNRKIPVRFFVIKSLQMRNIYTSVQYGIWATGRNNTRNIALAFKSCDHVILFFSANESGGYQGYARVMTLPDASLHHGIWGPYTPRLGSNFRVKWLKQCRVQFEQVLSPVDYNKDTRGMNQQGRQQIGIMTNILNEDKVVKKGRDCTEYASGLGVILSRKLAITKDIDILCGTEFEGAPRIDHRTFFESYPTELSRNEQAMRLGLLSGGAVQRQQVRTIGDYV
eukprot:GHVH01008142.1.p1 GENE.GHVH01008142.1~~GHVH01008142.1.p1  ORF type:complete len:636 (+),score=60.04 GHVH01008142.1:31-1938(+)